MLPSLPMVTFLSRVAARNAPDRHAGTVALEKIVARCGGSP